MSLINDVLKDLDRRQAPAGGDMPPSSPSPAPRGRPWGKGLAGGALFLGLALAAWWLWPASRPAHSNAPLSLQTPAMPQPAAPRLSPALPPLAAARSPAAVAAGPHGERPAANGIPPAMPADLPDAVAAVPPHPAATTPKSLASAGKQDRRFAMAQPKPAAHGVRRDSEQPLPAAREPARRTQRAESALHTAIQPSPPAMRPNAARAPAERAQALYASAMDNVDVDPLSAQADLEKSLAIEPRFSAARSQLALLLWKTGHSSQALRLVREGLRANPQDTGLSILLARLLAGLQHNREALQTLSALQHPPRNDSAYYGLLGTLARDQGRLGLARRAYQDALRLEPDNARWQMGLGLTLADQGQYGDARGLLQQVLRRLPADNEIAQYLQERLAQMP